MRALSRLGIDDEALLDAGCGSGPYVLEAARRWPRARVSGFDTDPSAISVARRRLACSRLDGREIALYEGDVTAGVEGLFDVIWCVDVLEHVSDDQLALTQLRASLRPGGSLLIHVPLLAQRRYFRYLKTWHQHDHVRDGYVEQDLIRLASDCDFSLVEKTYTFGKYGALAWELEHTAIRLGGIPLRLMLAPLYLVLSELEFHSSRPTGNGILIHLRGGSGNRPRRVRTEA